MLGKDFHAGVTKFGVANYEGTAKLKVKAPAQRPPRANPLALPMLAEEPQGIQGLLT